MTTECLCTRIIIRGWQPCSEMNWDFRVSEYSRTISPPNETWKIFLQQFSLCWHTYICSLIYYTCTRPFLERTFLSLKAYEYEPFVFEGLFHSIAEQRIRRDRISVADVLHVTRQMRRWHRAPARNLSLARCPPTVMSADWKSSESIPLDWSASNSATIRGKLVENVENANRRTKFVIILWRRCTHTRFPLIFILFNIKVDGNCA